MITSASGWRKVFASSGDENDSSSEIGIENTAISALAADTFAAYMRQRKPAPKIIVGMDTRPTGSKIADAVVKTLAGQNIEVLYCGVISAPEIMAFSHLADGFIYISASHNPIGHNGIKFGLDDGGVLNGRENKKLVEEFERRCSSESAVDDAKKLIAACTKEKSDAIYASADKVKTRAAKNYFDFAKEVISGTKDELIQEKLFSQIKNTVAKNPFGVAVDFNGSARTLSIDADFLSFCGINFYPINGKPGQIVHAIIPEPENLVHVARHIEKLHKEGRADAILGYMPDCDGDRGNIVYWDEKSSSAKILKAQEVFALSVLSELAWIFYCDEHAENVAVAVNCPTSMRIEEIAASFKAKVFRAEVGEANVVNLARERRGQGYTVRILGEGSNGGNITYPAAVRDPLNTLFALIKVLVVKDSKGKKGLFHLWCEKSGQESKYKEDFTLADVIESLPVYTTTGVSEGRAVLHVKNSDHAELKRNFQKVFESAWLEKKSDLKSRYGIFSYEAVRTNGTEEVKNISDYSQSGKGGLKIIFKDESGQNLAFIWMRGSGTEPVFRVMCDVKGDNPGMEASLLAWETEMIRKADET